MDCCEHQGANTIPVRLDDTAAVVWVFACAKTPKELLRFVTQYGPMASYGTTSWGDSVPGWLRRAQHFRELLLCKQSGPRRVAALCKAQIHAREVKIAKEAGIASPTVLEGAPYSLVGTIDLIPDPARGVRLRLTADSLVGAMSGN